MPVTILPLSAELPLEQLVAHLPLTVEPTQFRILGFGTNLLAAKVFLFPSPLTISLVEMELPAAMRVFAHAFDFLVHRTEFLRRRHVSRLLTSLNAGLESIRLQPSAGAGSR